MSCVTIAVSKLTSHTSHINKSGKLVEKNIMLALGHFQSNIFYLNLNTFNDMHRIHLGCGPLHAWQVRVLFGMWEKHELIGLNTIGSCFSHIPKRTCTCHACNGPHPKSLELCTLG
jgi:hypothetical protein